MFLIESKNVCQRKHCIIDFIERNKINDIPKIVN